MSTDPNDLARHAEKMKKRKTAQDKKTAQKTIEKGLLIVHTGTGKGKSTAAFGMAMRAIAHGQKIGIVQFIKGAWQSGERKIFEAYPDQVEIHALGEGFTWETQDKARDIELSQKAWDKAQELINNPAIDMVVLDELNIVLRYDYLPLDEVLAALTAR
ncbi:MAG: cob(I)yrinic acid a,c-diamide adenosyltransferase, partial [Hyphomicrobiales bacterium]